MSNLVPKDSRYPIHRVRMSTARPDRDVRERIPQSDAASVIEDDFLLICSWYERIAARVLPASVARSSQSRLMPALRVGHSAIGAVSGVSTTASGVATWTGGEYP